MTYEQIKNLTPGGCVFGDSYHPIQTEAATLADDAPMGPKQPHSTVFSTEEALIVAFRRHALLPLDDCLDELQATIPHLTHSARHRCPERYGINRLPEVEGNTPQKRQLKS
jgi:hypothetical protein